jgi:hypothetical protein
MLTVFVSRKISGFIAVGSLVMTLIGVGILMRTTLDLPLLVRAGLWLFVPAMAYGLITGVRQSLNPPKMFCADRRGVTIYYESGRKRYIEKGVFLPWKIVDNLTLEEIRVGGEDRGRTWIILCTLKVPAPFPVQAHSVAWFNSWSDLNICLDAFTGTVSKQELLDRLIPLWKAGSK